MKVKPMFIPYHSQAPAELFPTSVYEMKQQATLITTKVKYQIARLTSHTKEAHAFENTFLIFDRALGEFESMRSLFYAVQILSPDAEMRNEAHQQLNDLYTFSLVTIWHNKELYEHMKEYAQTVPASQSLTFEQQRFIEQLLIIYERIGMNLAIDKQKELQTLHQKLGPLALSFTRTLQEERSEIVVRPNDLTGVFPEFLASLSRTVQGEYIVPLHYPAYFHVMAYCAIENTREKFWVAFHNRGYPENAQILNEMLHLRQQIAALLSYTNFAEYDLANQMAHNTRTVADFLTKLLKEFREKAQIEKEELIKHHPAEIQLTKDFKLKPWDIDYYYAHSNNQETHTDLHEYFNFEEVFTALLDLCKDFFGTNFRFEKCTNGWHPSLYKTSVYREDELIGIVILDLFPRSGKYTHERHVNIIPALKKADGALLQPAVSIVIANLPAPGANNLCLLSKEQVSSVFHEFGHALHAVFGATELAFFSGTRVVSDFLEMPSQMLEEWMWDPKVLKKIGRHYKTKEALSDETIEKLIKNRYRHIGYWGERQLFLSFHSLQLHENVQETIKHHFEKLYLQTISYVDYDQRNNFFASFTHLATYASKYYSYLWSQVYAVDIFNYIQQQGFLESTIGKQYTDIVLGAGGSKDATKILSDFLGRSPSVTSFGASFYAKK